MMRASSESAGRYSTVMLTYLQSFLTREKYAAMPALAVAIRIVFLGRIGVLFLVMLMPPR